MSLLGYVLLLTAALCCTAAPSRDDIECTIPWTLNLIVSPRRISYRPNTKVSFSCEDGFNRVGSPSSTCTENGWNRPLPSCQKEELEALQTLEDLLAEQLESSPDIECTIPWTLNLIVSPHRISYRPNTKVSFGCEDGFSRVGARTSTCTENGWNPPLPSCQSLCTRPERMVEAELVGDWESDSYPAGTEAVYQCRPGYNQIGTIKKTCIRGKWEYFGKKGECKIFFSRQDANRVLKIQKRANTLMEELKSGNLERECYEEKCDFEEVNEIFETRKDTLNFWTVYLDGDQCLSNPCTNGVCKDGIGKFDCICPREWEGKLCSHEPCSPPPLLHGKYTPRKNEFTNEEYLQYECDTGYMTERRNLLATAQCLDGKWSEIPNCIAITCEHDSFLYKNKAVITYTCPHGKRPKSNLVQCFYYGWGPPVICQEEKPGQPDATNPSTDNIEKEEKRQKCPLAHNPKNAEIVAVKNAYYSNDEVTMKCTEGYRMYGSATIRCIHGKWEQPPECYEIGDQCGPPPPIKFGDTIEMKKIIYKPDEFVEYQCAIYHVFSGEKIVKCQNGVWGETPVCLEPCTAKERRMDENNIQLKVLGEKKKYLTHGDEIEFNCIFGYEALPNTQMRIACKHGKLEYPNCLRKGFCILQQQEMIANNIHYNESTVVERGQTIKFQCNEAMIPEMELEATCRFGNIQYPKCTAAKS